MKRNSTPVVFPIFDHMTILFSVEIFVIIKMSHFCKFLFICNC